MSPAALGLVIPVFNEAERLEDFGSELLRFAAALPHGSEVLFVDDGSTDGTIDRIEDLARRHAGAPVRVLALPHRGKGAALSAGLRDLTAPVRGFCDVDLSTPLADLIRIAAAGSRPGVLAIGSRDLVGSVMVRPEGQVRQVMGRVYNRLLQATVTPGVVDTQCGAKVAAAAVWDAVLPLIGQEGFAWDAEVVAVAVALGFEVQEMPVEWRHDSRSRIRLVRDGLSMVASTPHIWLSARRARRARPPAAATPEVFEAGNAQRLIEADRSHWWFRSKAALVASALRRTAPDRPPTGWLVDAGAGGGGVTAMLGWPPQRVLALEGNEMLVRNAITRHGLHAARSEVDDLPVRPGVASVVCLLDVLEHLEDPVAALRAAAGTLAPGGRILINVPAHAWLWSEADVELGHLRRYTRSMLRREVVAAGLHPVVLTHVFSWLVPATWLARRVANRGRVELGLDRTGPMLDLASSALTWLERHLIGRVSLPLGTSVLSVAVRAEDRR